MSISLTSNRDHLPSVHAEKEVDGTSSSALFEGLVQPLVSGIRRTPYLVFERFVNIIFCIRLDDEVASLGSGFNWRYHSKINNVQNRGGHQKWMDYSPFQQSETEHQPEN